ncbi:MAG: ribbon-helix-helix protein, CopG family, partial [Betaproteobacteria bacterium]|nr:ribbon-helix-helix protein, CopG family [Betaproteobacteria bacterium]
MKNVTITLDADTVQRVRVEAAQRDLSLSRFIGEVLRERLRK